MVKRSQINSNVLIIGVILLIIIVIFVFVNLKPKELKKPVSGIQIQIKDSPFGLHAVYDSLEEAHEINAKTIRRVVRWQDAEPSPGKYNYKNFDDVVQRTQDYGMELVVTLRPVSEWGVGLEYKRETADYLSAYPKNMDAWLKFVSLLVERYDADGKNDMPGLRLPINFFQVDNEWLWQWRGTGEEYLQFLAETSKAIKSANPNAKVILGALTGLKLSAVVEGISSEDYVEGGDTDDARHRIYKDEIIKSTRYQEGMEKADIVLSKGQQYFDIIDFHSYSKDPYEIADSVKVLKSLMKKHNYQKLLWSLENAGPFYDFTQEKFAQDVVKRYMIGLSNGVERIFWSSLKPTLEWSENYVRLALIDTKGDKTPAYYTYQLMTEKLKGIRSIEQLATEKPLVVYRIGLNKGDIYIAWSNDGKQEVPLPIDAAAVKITHIITELGKTEPETEQINVDNGKVTLVVSSPIFVEPI